jgi:hypothetical protein
LIAVGALAFGTASAATIQLPVPNGFSLLGVSCGGVQVSSYVDSIDTATAVVKGTLKSITSCSGSGRGARTTVYTSYNSITWDLAGNIVSVMPCPCGAMDATFKETLNGYSVYDKTLPVRNAVWGAQIVSYLVTP